MSVDAKTYYDQNPNYSSTTQASPHIVHDFYDRLRHEFGESRVLDVGCGYGADALTAEQYGHSVVGLELSQASLDRFNLGARGREGTRGDVRNLPSNKKIRRLRQQQEFRAVFCGFVLIHLDMPAGRKALSAMAGILDKDGWILLATHAWEGDEMWSFKHRHFDDRRKNQTTFWVWPELRLFEAFAENFWWEQTHRLGRANRKSMQGSQVRESGGENREYHSVILEGRKR